MEQNLCSDHRSFCARNATLHERGTDWTHRIPVRAEGKTDKSEYQRTETEKLTCFQCRCEHLSPGGHIEWLRWSRLLVHRSSDSAYMYHIIHVCSRVAVCSMNASVPSRHTDCVWMWMQRICCCADRQTIVVRHFWKDDMSWTGWFWPSLVQRATCSFEDLLWGCDVSVVKMCANFFGLSNLWCDNLQSDSQGCQGGFFLSLSWTSVDPTVQPLAYSAVPTTELPRL